MNEEQRKHYDSEERYVKKVKMTKKEIEERDKLIKKLERMKTRK